MSTAGLYSNLYTRLRDYAELLDQVLIRLKLGDSSSSDENQRKLGQLLMGLAKSPSTELSTQFLVILLQRENKKNLTRWEKIGQALLSDVVTQDMILQLERLANTLENERAGTFARMRGGNAQ